MSDNVSVRSICALLEVRDRHYRCTLSPKYEAEILEIISKLDAFCAKHKLNPDHGLVHAMRVYEHARYAYALIHSISARDVFCGLVAALLHDVDDHKLFQTEDYANAREILCNLCNEDVESIIHMIGLVSFSANGNNTEGIPFWQLIPRFCDRLEAIGDEGVERCLDYTLKKGRPLFTPNTPRFTSIEEMRTETLSRMLAYTGASESFIDHFYDKLGHLHLDVDNEYINEISQFRMNATYEIILDFGRTGTITEKEVRSRLR